MGTVESPSPATFGTALFEALVAHDGPIRQGIETYLCALLHDNHTVVTIPIFAVIETNSLARDAPTI
jgi:hypothetical protein